MKLLLCLHPYMLTIMCIRFGKGYNKTNKRPTLPFPSTSTSRSVYTDWDRGSGISIVDVIMHNDF